SRRSRYLRLEQIPVAVDTTLLDEQDSGGVCQVVSVYRDLVVIAAKSDSGIKGTIGLARRIECESRWHRPLMAPVDVQETGIICDPPRIVACHEEFLSRNVRYRITRGHGSRALERACDRFIESVCVGATDGQQQLRSDLEIDFCLDS